MVTSCFTHTQQAFPTKQKAELPLSQVLAKGKLTSFFCNQISCGSPIVAGALLPVPHYKQLSYGAHCLRGLIKVGTPSRQSIGQAMALASGPGHSSCKVRSSFWPFLAYYHLQLPPLSS